MASFFGTAEIPFDFVSDWLEDMKVETTEFEHEMGSFADAMKATAKEIGEAMGAMGTKIGVGTGGTGGAVETEDAPEENADGLIKIIPIKLEMIPIDTTILDMSPSVATTLETTADLESIWEDYWDSYKEGVKDAISTAKELMSSLSGVVSALNNKEMTEFQNMKKAKQEKEQEVWQEEYDRELLKIENSTMNEKAKNKAISELDEKYNKKKEQSDKKMDAKEAAIKRKQAQRDKKLNIMNAIISTASAIAAALPIIPLAVAVGIMGAAQVGLIASTPIPAFADGGIISGPTVGLMGEYSGAKNNPEVVAPLNKLKGMMGEGQQNITVEGRISGNDILLISQKAQFERNRFI